MQTIQTRLAPSSDEQLEDNEEGIQGDEWDPHVLLEGVDEEYQLILGAVQVHPLR
jgi:hypothetical protein